MSHSRNADPTAFAFVAGVARSLWWVVLLRAVLAIIFGVLAMLAPLAALVGITVVFGIYLLLAGLVEIVQAVQTRRSERRWGWLLAQGIVSVLAGLATLIVPGVAGLVGGLFVLWSIVVYAILHGIFGLVSAAGLASSAEPRSAKTWGILAGILALVFGVVLAVLTVASPGVTLLSLIWVVGLYTIVFGVLLLIGAFRVRSLGRRLADTARDS